MTFRNKGKSGTLPSIRSQAPTYRISVGDGLYSFGGGMI